MRERFNKFVLIFPNLFQLGAFGIRAIRICREVVIIALHDFAAFTQSLQHVVLLFPYFLNLLSPSWPAVIAVWKREDIVLRSFRSRL
jgi:hypothetical protein